MTRATYELEPVGAGEWLGRVVESDGERVVVELPDAGWGGDVAVLVTTVLGEVQELAAVTRCRLVGLDLPVGLLPGPAFGAGGGTRVGVIVKPAVGLSPPEVAEVVAAVTAAGATFVKDDERLGDPPSCPLEERVRAVAKVLPDGVTYSANVTGPTASLVERARRVVDLGATGVMVGLGQGLDAVLALRRAELGVPILAHRAGAGAWCRNERFGTTEAVLCRLARLCGADHVVVGAFGGSLFDTDGQVEANLTAAAEPLPGAVRPAWALLGGGLGPDDVAEQAARAGGQGVVVVLGSRAYSGSGGVGAAVEAAVQAVSA